MKTKTKLCLLAGALLLLSSDLKAQWTTVTATTNYPTTPDASLTGRNTSNQIKKIEADGRVLDNRETHSVIATEEWDGSSFNVKLYGVVDPFSNNGVSKTVSSEVLIENAKNPHIKVEWDFPNLITWVYVPEPMKDKTPEMDLYKPNVKDNFFNGANPSRIISGGINNHYCNCGGFGGGSTNPGPRWVPVNDLGKKAKMVVWITFEDLSSGQIRVQKYLYDNGLIVRDRTPNKDYLVINSSSGINPRLTLLNKGQDFPAVVFELSGDIYITRQVKVTGSINPYEQVVQKLRDIMIDDRHDMYSTDDNDLISYTGYSSSEIYSQPDINGRGYVSALCYNPGIGKKYVIAVMLPFQLENNWDPTLAAGSQFKGTSVYAVDISEEFSSDEQIGYPEITASNLDISAIQFSDNPGLICNNRYGLLYERLTGNGSYVEFFGRGKDYTSLLDLSSNYILSELKKLPPKPAPIYKTEYRFHYRTISISDVDTTIDSFFCAEVIIVNQEELNEWNNMYNDIYTNNPYNKDFLYLTGSCSNKFPSRMVNDGFNSMNMYSSEMRGVNIIDNDVPGSNSYWQAQSQTFGFEFQKFTYSDRIADVYKAKRNPYFENGAYATSQSVGLGYRSNFFDLNTHFQTNNIISPLGSAYVDFKTVTNNDVLFGDELRSVYYFTDDGIYIRHNQYVAPGTLNRAVQTTTQSYNGNYFVNSSAAASSTLNSSSVNKSVIEYQIIPNPSQGSFRISVSQPMLDEGFTVKITDINGKELNQYKIKPGSASNTLDMNISGKGLYFVNIICRNNSEVKTVVIQ